LGHSWLRAGRLGLLLALLAGAIAWVIGADRAYGQGLGDSTLLADNAAAANPDLVVTTLQSPEGFRDRPYDVWLPPGFSMSVLAQGLNKPRFMAFDDAGNLLVGTNNSRIYRLAPEDGSIRPVASIDPILSKLEAPSNVAFYGGYMYVGESNQVSRFSYGADGSMGPQEVVVPDLPGDGNHTTRTLAFGPDGRMYVAVGSSCNICDETDDRRAAVLSYNPDGSDYQRVANGMRNPVGLAFQPGTGLLWATVNERDDQGNEIPPDLVTVVWPGANYGWPNCQPPNATPQTPGAACDGITPPTVGIQAHSAPLGLTFYSGSQFPADYVGDLFVVQHGSWNRQPPAAPKIMRVHFENGQPVSVNDFATGWQDELNKRWGRPVGVITAPDGSLIVSDDDAGLLYRITYTGS
jgi:glucose/arabinose dehydrogenase